MKRWTALLALPLVALLGCAAPAPQRSAAPLNIASYNLRLNLASDGPNAWPQRRATVQALLRYHEVDIVGTQEGLIDQIEDLEAMGDYARVGVGRDDGARGGEHSAIFFRKSRFEALRHGDFWLSETPDRPSLGWDARCCKRLASWVELRDRQQAARSFYVFSVHFDHEGEVARRESARLLLQRIAQIAGSAPVFALGDFNSTPETAQIRLMQASLRDAYLASETAPYGPLGTFNDFRIDAPMRERIDYIFVSPGIRVLKYGVLSDSLAGRFPSDHHPVLVRASLD
jgi:endonuclease/exonuclease/phosphatase family metal-dependent hydrolase